MIHASNADRAQLPVEDALRTIKPILHALMAEFIQAADQNEHHRVMFVSPESGDGTTTLAAVTALMLVRHFRRDVALIEANVYSPAMASYLGIPPTPGLIELADGVVDSKEVVRNSMLNGLYVLSAGGSREPEEGELAGQRLQRLISSITKKHRFTVIDAPPLLERPEACLLLEHVDQVVLVVRAGSTVDERARAAIRIVENAGGTVSGVLLNRFKPSGPFGLSRLLKV